MSDAQRQVVYDGGQLFRVEQLSIAGRELPYEFVRRTGAAVVIPVFFDEYDIPRVLMIENTRTHYGTSVGLPGGNQDGGFDQPEEPIDTAQRELAEETSFGFAPGPDRSLDAFKMRAFSSSIDYPRYVVVMRDVRDIGGAELNPHEVVVPKPVSIDDFLAPLINMQAGNLYPEINLAFAKAAKECGPIAVRNWLINGGDDQMAQKIVTSFEPWLLPLPAASAE